MFVVRPMIAKSRSDRWRHNILFSLLRSHRLKRIDTSCLNDVNLAQQRDELTNIFSTGKIISYIIGRVHIDKMILLSLFYTEVW